eukprot:jgi/Chlat1/7384/Chrsp6S09187
MSGAAPQNDKYFLLSYEYVPDILERRTAHRTGHLALAKEYEQRNQLLLAGAHADPVDGATFIFHAPRTAVEEFIAADPYMKAELVPKHTIREWTPVVGTALAGKL